MWFIPAVMLVLGLLAVLIIPSYLGYARKAACLEKGGTWIAQGGCQLPSEVRPPASAN